MMSNSNDNDWWKEFLPEDISEDTFTTEQKTLFKIYKVSLDQIRLFHSIRTGRNLFLSELITDEEIVWNIGVMGVGNKHRGNFKFYRNSVIERLQRYDEAERKYQWHSAQWTEKSMRILIEQWTLGMMVVIPGIESLDVSHDGDIGSPMIFTKEWYEHMPLRKDLPEGFWEYRATVVYPLMARSICRSYPMATMKGLVSLADMTNFDSDKYDMEMKARHSDLQGVIPNKLRRMISINPDEEMKEQLKEFGNLAKKYGYVMYDTLEEAMEKEAGLLPSSIDNLPTWVGGTLKVDIKDCLKYLFRCEPDALKLMEEVYNQMEENGEILHPKHMQYQNK